MKKLITILILYISLISCEHREKSESNTGKILKNKHELRKLKATNVTNTYFTASYFLIAGSSSGGTYTTNTITFSWKMNTGEYAISEFPISKIRIKIDNSVITPFINFRWSPSYIDDLDYIMKRKVQYILITCKEEDYPVDINLITL